MTRPKVLSLGTQSTPHPGRSEARRRFALARLALGWTLEATARELGAGRNSVQRRESGAATLPAWALVTLERLAAERRAA